MPRRIEFFQLNSNLSTLAGSALSKGRARVQKRLRRAAGATNTLRALLPPALSLSSQSVLIIVSVLHIIGFNKAIKVIAFFARARARGRPRDGEAEKKRDLHSGD